MLKINIDNVEELIFYDKQVQKLLPEFTHYFDQWKLGIRIPGLRNLGKRSLIDFLNNLEENHIELLSQHFDNEVIVDRLNYNIVKNYEFDINSSCETLNEIENLYNLSLHRRGNRLYVSAWR